MVVIEDGVLYACLDDNNRICNITPDKNRTNESYIKFTFTEDFNYYKFYDYILVDGHPQYSPAPLSEEDIRRNIERERKAQVEIAAKMFVQKNSKLFSDKEALSVSHLFSEWNPMDAYTEGDIVNYKKSLYRMSKSITYETAPVAPDAENSTWIIIK